MPIRYASLYGGYAYAFTLPQGNSGIDVVDYVKVKSKFGLQIQDGKEYCKCKNTDGNYCTLD